VHIISLYKYKYFNDVADLSTFSRNSFNLIEERERERERRPFWKKHVTDNRRKKDHLSTNKYPNMKVSPRSSLELLLKEVQSPLVQRPLEC
jgi:hypothetical protein